MTAFEPEAIGNLVEGLDFHKFYFDNREYFLQMVDFLSNFNIQNLFSEEQQTHNKHQHFESSRSSTGR